MRREPTEISCEMCLQADEPPSMVYIDVELIPGERIRTAVFCRRCIAAILLAAHRQLESENDDLAPADPTSGGEDQGENQPEESTKND